MTSNYKRFVGKVCTVMTHPTAMPLRDPLAASQYLTGLVAEVNDDGIWVQHLVTKNMGFFQFPLIGVVEEQYVQKDTPEHEKVKQEIEAAKPAPPANFTSVSDLAKMAKELKGKK